MRTLPSLPTFFFLVRCILKVQDLSKETFDSLAAATATDDFRRCVCRCCGIVAHSKLAADSKRRAPIDVSGNVHASGERFSPRNPVDDFGDALSVAAIRYRAQGCTVRNVWTLVARSARTQRAADDDSGIRCRRRCCWCWCWCCCCCSTSNISSRSSCRNAGERRSLQRGRCQPQRADVVCCIERKWPYHGHCGPSVVHRRLRVASTAGIYSSSSFFSSSSSSSSCIKIFGWGDVPSGRPNRLWHPTLGAATAASSC